MSTCGKISYCWHCAGGMLKGKFRPKSLSEWKQSPQNVSRLWCSLAEVITQSSSVAKGPVAPFNCMFHGWAISGIRCLRWTFQMSFLGNHSTSVSKGKRHYVQYLQNPAFQWINRNATQRNTVFVNLRWTLSLHSPLIKRCSKSLCTTKYIWSSLDFIWLQQIIFLLHRSQM